MDLYLLDKKSFAYLKAFYLQNLSPQQLLDNTGLSFSNIELELDYLLKLNFITRADGFHCDLEGIHPKNIYEITPAGRSYYEAILEQRKLDKKSSLRANVALVVSIISILVTLLKWFIFLLTQTILILLNTECIVNIKLGDVFQN